MTDAEIKRLFERMTRLSSSLETRGGSGVQWEYRFPDGDVQNYRIVGVRPADEIEDDIAHLLIWIWSMKDHLIHLAKDCGRDPNEIEAAINANPALCLCADLANLLKHGRLRKSRSRLWPFLGRARYQIPDGAIDHLMFWEGNTGIHVKDASKVEITVPVEDQGGRPLGDAISISQEAIAFWEEEFEKIRRNA
jgi:hypothetical protein